MIFERTAIFEKDPTHPSCHCSVIQELPNKQLMAVWYAGKSEAHKTVGLKASWKEIDGDSWSKPELIWKTPKKADGNAVIIFYQGKLHMYFNTIHGLLFPWTKVILQKIVSEDFGHTWSEPKVLMGESQKGYTVRTKPIIVGDRLIIPSGKETIRLETAQMLITDDGKSYHLSKDLIQLPSGSCHQPAITQLANGDLLAYLRTKEGFIFESRSLDLGETWTTPEKMSFQNPNSALDFVRTDRGELILVWNNTVKKGGTMASRKTLNIAYSTDEGQSWGPIKEIERNDQDGRFSYPAIIHGSDDLFHLTYSNRRKNITYVKFDREWLQS